MFSWRSRRRRLATPAERLADLPVIELDQALRVYEARSWVARRDGLSGLRTISDDHGLWIAPCRSIHTFGMRFWLDLIWLDREGQVLSVDHDVPPRRQRANWRARSVIEVGRGRGDVFAKAWSEPPPEPRVRGGRG